MALPQTQLDVASAGSPAGSLEPLPLSLAAELPSGWPDRLVWPVTLDDRRARTLGLLGTALDWLQAIGDDDLRRAATLAGASFLTDTARILDRAHTLAGAATQGRTTVGGDAETAWLQQGGPAPTLAAPTASPLPGGALRRLRGLRHARRWTPGWRMLAVAAAPQATVLSLNDLLVDCARRSGLRLAYTDPRRLLPYPSAAADPPDESCRDLARQWAERTFAAATLPEPLATRAREHVAQHAANGLAAAMALFAALRTTRLPKHLWAGTGGNMTTRALGLETVRRGGTVTRFNHGGSVGMTAYADKLAFLEFTASTAYVAPTAPLAEILYGDAAARAWPAPIAIEHGEGDPQFARIPVRGARERPSRPRLAYVTGLFPVHQIHFPPVPPDPVYYAWQLRLVAALKRLPVDLVCRPHPENLLIFDRQPLAGHAELVDAPFADVVAASDVVLFDWAQTTTFWETLCSDRPVVLIDVNRTAFHPKVRDAIARRCRIVEVAGDERNLPCVDADALAEAVCDAPARADPTEIRTLLAGTP